MNRGSSYLLSRKISLVSVDQKSKTKNKNERKKGDGERKQILLH